MEKYFQRQFWEVRHAQNIIKITPNERGDQTHYLAIYIYIFFLNATPSKMTLKIFFLIFLRFLHILNYKRP